MLVQNDRSVNYTVRMPSRFRSSSTGYADTAALASAGFKELFIGNSPRPRLSIGVGVNWTSPFGPLRLDLAKAILKQKGDEPKLFSFNVGTQF